MTCQEAIDVINSISEINLEEADCQDQLLIAMATAQFAEQIKPIVVKYANKLPENSTFLVKL